MAGYIQTLDRACSSLSSHRARLGHERGKARSRARDLLALGNPDEPQGPITTMLSFTAGDRHGVLDCVDPFLLTSREKTPTQVRADRLGQAGSAN
jgi:hypothetical protein